MAGSSRKSIGLSLALTLIAWGFSGSAFSSNVSLQFYYTYGGQLTPTFSSPAAACNAVIALNFHHNYTLTLISLGTPSSVDPVTGAWPNNYSASCIYSRTDNRTGQTITRSDIVRQFGVCSSPYTYDPTSGMCTTCPSTQGQTKELKGPESPITFSGGAGFVMWAADSDASYCVDSCSYSGAAKTGCYAVSSGSDRGFCNFIVAGLGDSCDAESAPLASSGSPITSPTDPVDPVDPVDPGDTGGGDSGGGGNAGGGNSGSPVTPPDPVDTGNPDAATTGDVATLGNRLVDATYAAANGVISALNGLGNKVDAVGDKVDGLGDKLDDLNGDPYSEGEGEGADNADAIGEQHGDSLAELIDQAVDDAKQSREDVFNEEVGKIDGMLAEWFGDDPSAVGGSILDSLFPTATGCDDFIVKWHQQGYSINLPVCQLTRLKVILEWVFGILAAIVVWRIIMNSLNQSATSAVRHS